jgi:hypothetical protein
MRRTVILLVMATMLSLHLATGVANAKGTISVGPNPQGELNKVTISGKTGCRKKGGVHVRSHVHDKEPWRRAIKGRVLKIHTKGKFKGVFTVRSTAVGDSAYHYPIVSHCKWARGKASAKTHLWVLPFTGIPVLPQLLGGVGLIASGAAMVRRGRTGPRNRPRRRTGRRFRWSAPS